MPQTRANSRRGDPRNCWVYQDPDQEIYVGSKTGKVYLWKTGTVLRWTVVMKNAKKFKTAKEAFSKAIKDWKTKALKTDAGYHVDFVYEDDKERAHFQVIYEVDPSRPDLGARAFFPDDYKEKPNYVTIFNNQLDFGPTPELVGLLRHEIGHIIGLRHEFAQKDDDLGNKAEDPKFGLESILFRGTNPLSVMSYEDGYNIQESDSSAVKELYDTAANNTVIKGMSSTGNEIEKTIRRVKPAS